MTGIDVAENFRRQIEHAAKCRDEKLTVVVGAKSIVRTLYCGFQVVGALKCGSCIAQISNRGDHEQCGGNTFARNVSDRYEQMILWVVGKLKSMLS